MVSDLVGKFIAIMRVGYNYTICNQYACILYNFHLTHSDLHWLRFCLNTLEVLRERSHLNTVHPILVVD